MVNNITIKTSVIDFMLVITSLIGLAIIYLLYLTYPQYIKFALLIGVFVYTGFLLPRLIGKKTREENARRAKRAELERWGFHGRDREGPWINYIDYPLIKETHLATGKKFYSDWLIIDDGMIMVNPGPATTDLDDNTVSYDYTTRRTYAWDGCTPKKWFYWIILTGTPDLWQKTEKIQRLDANGKKEFKQVFWQKAHHASLVHDALYQYLGIQPISKRQVDQLFYQMLRESGFGFFSAKLYHLAVYYFGAGDIKDKDREPPDSNLQIKELPD